jgi:hypothetical protein
VTTAHKGPQALLAILAAKDGLLGGPSLLRLQHAPAAPPPSAPVRLLGMLLRARTATPVGLDALSPCWK